MSSHTYKLIELTGSSSEGMQQAIESALSKANESVNNMRWFEVTETRGQIEKGKVAHWQVSIKVGFTLQ